MGNANEYISCKAIMPIAQALVSMMIKAAVFLRILAEHSPSVDFWITTNTPLVDRW